jgi:hypothetical protein
MTRILFLALLLTSRLAWAGLDQAPLRASATPVPSTPAATSAGVAYTVMHRTLPNGVQVDEYVDAASKVFALSWSGPFKPDLKELLGTHFDGFRKGAEAHRHGNRSRLAVDTGDVVVVSEGHMGAFQGRAWVPASLPAGFDTQEMK